MVTKCPWLFVSLRSGNEYFSGRGRTPLSRASRNERWDGQEAHVSRGAYVLGVARAFHNSDKIMTSHRVWVHHCGTVKITVSLWLKGVPVTLLALS